MDMSERDIELLRQYHGLIGGAYTANAEDLVRLYQGPLMNAEGNPRVAALRAQLLLLRQLDHAGALRQPRGAEADEHLPCMTCGGTNLYEYSESNRRLPVTHPDRNGDEHTVECMTCHTRAPIAVWNGEDRALDEGGAPASPLGDRVVDWLAAPFAREAG